MDLSTISLEEFLCRENIDFQEAGMDPFDQLREEDISGFVGANICEIGAGYSICYHAQTMSAVFLVHDGKPVGFYIGDLISINPSHRREALSVPMILHATRQRACPLKQTLTNAGLSALTKAWH